MAARQLDMFALWQPPAAVIARPRYEPPPRRTVMTRAYGQQTPLQIEVDRPDPVEVEILGVQALIVFNYGAGIYALEKPGSPFFSSTGYRSMAHGEVTSEQVIDLVEEHYRASPAKYGLGKKLVLWWPPYVTQWQGAEAWDIEYADRTTVWAQWGPEKWAETWARHDASRAAALEQMRAEGIDPNEVGPPKGFKGKWPRF